MDFISESLICDIATAAVMVYNNSAQSDYTFTLARYKLSDTIDCTYPIVCLNYFSNVLLSKLIRALSNMYISLITFITFVI